MIFRISVSLQGKATSTCCEYYSRLRQSGTNRAAWSSGFRSVWAEPRRRSPPCRAPWPREPPTTRVSTQSCWTKLAKPLTQRKRSVVWSAHPSLPFLLFFFLSLHIFFDVWRSLRHFFVLGQMIVSAAYCFVVMWWHHVKDILHAVFVNILHAYKYLDFYLCFSAAEKKKCTCGLTGEAVTGENLGLQSGCADQHWAGESAAGTAHTLVFCFFTLSPYFWSHPWSRA